MRQTRTHSRAITRTRSIQRWILAGCLVFVSVAVGFHYGQQIPASRLTAHTQTVTANDGQADHQAFDVRSHLLVPEIAAPLRLAAQGAAQPVMHTAGNSKDSNDNDNLAEIEYLSLTASRLRKRVASLEWETLTLESDLLSREIELGKALDELDRSKQLRRDVYNFTNVPIGSYVAPAQTMDNGVIIARQSEAPEIAPSLAPSDTAYKQEQLQHDYSDQQQESARQRVFFGPAEDRYEDLVNPGLAETPHQAWTYGE